MEESLKRGSGRDFCGSSEQKGDPLRPENLEEEKISKAKVDMKKG